MNLLIDFRKLLALAVITGLIISEYANNVADHVTYARPREYNVPPVKADRQKRLLCLIHN